LVQVWIFNATHYSTGKLEFAAGEPAVSKSEIQIDNVQNGRRSGPVVKYPF